LGFKKPYELHDEKSSDAVAITCFSSFCPLVFFVWTSQNIFQSKEMNGKTHKEIKSYTATIPKKETNMK